MRISEGVLPTIGRTRHTMTIEVYTFKNLNLRPKRATVYATIQGDSVAKNAHPTAYRIVYSNSPSRLILYVPEETVISTKKLSNAVA